MEMTKSEILDKTKQILKYGFFFYMPPLLYLYNYFNPYHEYWAGVENLLGIWEVGLWMISVFMLAGALAIIYQISLYESDGKIPVDSIYKEQFEKVLQAPQLLVYPYIKLAFTGFVAYTGDFSLFTISAIGTFVAFMWHHTIIKQGLERLNKISGD